jgi:hypothetical protein
MDIEKVRNIFNNKICNMCLEKGEPEKLSGDKGK